MLDLIDRAMGFVGDLLKAAPDQNGATDMIAHDTGLAALTAFQPSQLLGFAVKLLDFPPEAAHILDDLHVRALGRQHYSEDFHPVLGWKALDFDDLAALLLGGGPGQAVQAAIGLRAPCIISATWSSFVLPSPAGL